MMYLVLLIVGLIVMMLLIFFSVKLIDLFLLDVS